MATVSEEIARAVILEFSPDGALDEQGRPAAAWGFTDPVSGVFITTPYLSPCSRFEVDPMTAYGLSKEEADKIMDLNDGLVRLRRILAQARDGQEISEEPPRQLDPSEAPRGR